MITGYCLTQALGDYVLNDSEDGGLSDSAGGPRSFAKRHRSSLIAAAAVLVVVVIIVVFGHYRSKAAASLSGPGRGGQDGPVAIAVATVQPGDIQIRIPALGTVTTLANVTVRTQISGTLQKILFTEGQLVHEGEVIAQIDPRPYQAALQTSQGNLRRDQALLADARLDLKRYEGLVKEDSIAVQQLDTQRALVDQYAGTIESDEGQVKTSQVNLIYTRIVSPVTGRVGIRQVDQGNYITPGDTNGIVTINQLQPISVLFSIPEDNVSALMKKVHGGTPLTVETYDRADSVKLADGNLLTVDNAIDTTTGTVKLRAQFDNADGALFPNQFVNVSLLQEVLHDQLIMPNSAVRRGAPNGVVSTFVYLVNADRTVSVRSVMLGVVDGERVAVKAGLAAGDMVVTEGGDRLRDGAKVLLPPAVATTAAKVTSAAADGQKPPGTRPPGAHHRPRPAAPQ
jgi:multidrug efflux system membrane fusion protein